MSLSSTRVINERNLVYLQPVNLRLLTQSGGAFNRFKFEVLLQEKEKKEKF